jgi:hypothetical protein
VWNVLLCQTPVPYFAKLLINKGKLKRVCEFQEKFPKVLNLLRNFFRLGGSTKFKILYGESMEYDRNLTYMPSKQLLFALMDLQDILEHNVPEDHVK